mmetsp:Transcript_51922/g.149705  ORF Transcript_51922/g.149705 Transcript_51922/m.149705 type:complete len:375 (+) Transcript_51922:84-1208(+)
MSPSLACLAALAAVASATAAPPDFDAYCASYGKEYSGNERTERKALFEQRAATYAELNARPGRTWTAGLGPMTDLWPEEMQRFFGYAGRSEAGGTSESMSAKGDREHDLHKMPRAVDWRNQTPSIVPPVRSQGSCGSCWAFSAVATIESVVAQATGTMPTLSPQQITSCTPNPKNCGGGGGCMGATAQLAYNYTVEKGIADLETAPYTSGRTARTGVCKADYPAVAGITGYVQLPLNNAPSLLRAVATKGLISVSVDANRWSWYRSGIFDHCNKENPIPNHAVTLVGYGEEAGVMYWLIQNSWGTGFGEAGYIRLRRYKDEPCGLNTDPQQNSGCDGGPPSVTVCGECAVLSDSSYPTGGYLKHDRRLHGGFFV